MFSQFICKNYVEDKTSSFHLVYSPKFFNFFFRIPPFNPDFNVCIFFKDVMIGSICGLRDEMVLNGKNVLVLTIDFLCVHKDFRNMKLAPVLIKEITRRANLKKIYQAIYTSGTELHKTFISPTYYHRVINHNKLVQCGFHSFNDEEHSKVTSKMNKPKKVEGVELVPISKKKRHEVYELLTNFNKKFKVYPVFSFEKFNYIFKNDEEIGESFMVLGQNNEVEVFISYYKLDSDAQKATQLIRGAYLYYYAYKDYELFKKALKQLVFILSEKKFDVFNCLNLMDNEALLKELRFGSGTGCLNYYLFNYHLNNINNSDVCLVLH